MNQCQKPPPDRYSRGFTPSGGSLSPTPPLAKPRFQLLVDDAEKMLASAHELLAGIELALDRLQPVDAAAQSTVGGKEISVGSIEGRLSNLNGGLDLLLSRLSSARARLN